MELPYVLILVTIFSRNIMLKPNPAIPIYHGRQWPVGLANAAKRIGVTQGHLHQVLTGKRQSRKAAQAYAELVAELKASSGVSGLN